MRARLDIEMARRGLAESRETARRLIMAGRVRINSRPADKPDLLVTAESNITVVGSDPEVAGRHALDVGASTGGFTDVLLKRGAAHVIALDVGYGQIAERLRTDPRVTVLDRTNVRLVEPRTLPYLPDLVTIDTSFISLRIVIPAVLALVAAKAEIIALVKPQFEVGKGKVGKGGIVRDDALRRVALEEVLNFARQVGLGILGSIDSPIAGARGNREFLVAMQFARPGN
jgi:23S rRNA (cytidine1920-2'-O)/16S rRNA (cytidine1409-2'-O)-methyltransferase